MSAELHEPVELLIIRRRSGLDTETPKGGVWKIAFADFMTAMMAFFLVMWLINATDDSTKKQVANYFNPVNLADMRLNPKGIRDPDKVDPAGQGKSRADSAEHEKSNEPAKSAEHEKPAEPDPVSGASQNPAKARFSDEALFRDPYAVLAELAAEADARHPGGDKAGAGEAYRDPFDPLAWRPSGAAAALQGPEAAPVAAEVVQLRPAEPVDEQKPENLGPADPATAANSDAAGQARSPANEAGSRGAPAHADALSELADPASALANPSSAGLSDDNAPAEKLQAEIDQALQAERASKLAPDIEVRGIDEGILISLTDEAAFGMFAIGSAEPQPETVRIMEKLAEILTSRPGVLVIRGHTDGRAFKSENYDNWRLSTARAHMAYYMLVRGGLDEMRVERIEGYADRDLKIPGEPEAAQNRRIDILVRDSAP